jgi:hypothetical protein
MGTVCPNRQQTPLYGPLWAKSRPATAGLSRYRGEEVLADLAIGGRVVKEADGARRPEAIWGISG